MKIITSRPVVAVVGVCTALLVTFPAYSMDIMERIVTTQTQSIRREASEYQRKVALANAHAYMAAQYKKAQHASSATPSPGSKHTKTTDSQDTKAIKKKLPDVYKRQANRLLNTEY